jgi:hypothetical protein
MTFGFVTMEHVDTTITSSKVYIKLKKLVRTLLLDTEGL